MRLSYVGIDGAKIKHSTRTAIHRLIAYIMARGTLIAVVQIAHVILGATSARNWISWSAKSLSCPRVGAHQPAFPHVARISTHFVLGKLCVTTMRACPVFCPALGGAYALPPSIRVMLDETQHQNHADPFHTASTRAAPYAHAWIVRWSLAAFSFLRRHPRPPRQAPT